MRPTPGSLKPDGGGGSSDANEAPSVVVEASGPVVDVVWGIVVVVVTSSDVERGVEVVVGRDVVVDLTVEDVVGANVDVVEELVLVLDFPGTVEVVDDVDVEEVEDVVEVEEEVVVDDVAMVPSIVTRSSTTQPSSGPPVLSPATRKRSSKSLPAKAVTS